MGNILSAIADDEDEWYSILKEAGIEKEVKWKVYSKEAGFATEGYSKHNLKGSNLIKYVNLNLEIQKVLEDSYRDAEDYKTYLVLKKRFEKS